VLPVDERTRDDVHAVLLGDTGYLRGSFSAADRRNGVSRLWNWLRHPRRRYRSR
jgi:hypothetical protein